ncbi:hypothetical protein NPIL_669031 [Nephila pilipes]|uniref:Uncharacterized protein n=1 Tax=Nephila pilipes TaxID=299642 RepID=A0A8X6JRU3_NEPPI|nr:hypothetical protein NPIL_669031 [Nephila pilipes]
MNCADFFYFHHYGERGYLRKWQRSASWANGEGNRQEEIEGFIRDSFLLSSFVGNAPSLCRPRESKAALKAKIMPRMKTHFVSFFLIH